MPAINSSNDKGIDDEAASSDEDKPVMFKRMRGLEGLFESRRSFWSAWASKRF